MCYKQTKTNNSFIAGTLNEPGTKNPFLNPGPLFSPEPGAARALLAISPQGSICQWQKWQCGQTEACTDSRTFQILYLTIRTIHPITHLTVLSKLWFQRTRVLEVEANVSKHPSFFKE